jgi:AcrR family transcriptional regulator
VGSLGFEAATIEVIAEACGHTRTVIYSRYQNKYELFMDASERMLAQVIPLNMAYQDDLAARVPVTIAETCMVREFMRPERQAMRTITFEQMRLSWHDPRLRKAIRGALAAHMRQVAADSPGRTPESFGAGIMIDVAITNGLALLAQIEPAIWQLPFDTVIVPWRRSQRAATGLAD